VSQHLLPGSSAAERVLEHLPVAVVALDGAGRFDAWNAAAARLLGYRADEAIGRTGAELGFTPVPASLAATGRATLSEGRTYHVDVPAQRRDGRSFLARVAAAPRPDGGVVVVFTDVASDASQDAQRDTSLRAEQGARAAAEQANGLLEAVLGQVPVGLGFFDRQLRYVLVNEALARVNGISARDHVGRSPTELLTDIPEEVGHQILEIFETGTTITDVEVTGETPAAPGQLRTWLVSYWPVRIGDEIPLVGITVLEITERHRAEQERQRLLDSLQRSLLPARELTIGPLQVATRYRPVGAGEVGGDFYDAFPVGDQRWLLVIGDASGKGVEAAALTALVRNTVRAAARFDPDPAAVLAVLNEAVLTRQAEQGDEQFCTAAVVLVDCSDDRATVDVTAAGHPRPLLRTADGAVQEIGAEGWAVGLFPAPELPVQRVVLEPGDTLVLCTDGYTEARSPAGTFAPDLLHIALERIGEMDAEPLAEALEAAVMEYTGGQRRDDMALVVLRVPVSE
jgi:PAS domain S-box-containing protein